MLLCLQSDDEEAAKEEEAEALRLQRKEAEALRPEDFEQPSEPESEEEAEGAEEEAGTLGAAAARVGFLHPCVLLSKSKLPIRSTSLGWCPSLWHQDNVRIAHFSNEHRRAAYMLTYPAMSI